MRVETNMGALILKDEVGSADELWYTTLFVSLSNSWNSHKWGGISSDVLI